MPDGPQLAKQVATINGTPKWVLGRRHHLRALKRKAHPTPINEFRSFAERQLRLLVPWTLYEYPGLTRFAAAIFGVASETARKIIDGNKPLPFKQAATLADILEERGRAYLKAAEECRAYAAGDATKPRGFRTGHGVARNQRPSASADTLL